jgi:hypothetical protein
MSALAAIMRKYRRLLGNIAISIEYALKIHRMLRPSHNRPAMERAHAGVHDGA